MVVVMVAVGYERVLYLHNRVWRSRRPVGFAHAQVNWPNLASFQWELGEVRPHGEGFVEPLSSRKRSFPPHL